MQKLGALLLLGLLLITGASPALAQVQASQGVYDTGALLTRSAAAAGGNGADQSNRASKGLKCIVDVTAITGTSPTYTVTIQGKDGASGKYFTLLASAALNAAATTTLTVYPGVTASANVAAADVLPRIWRVVDAIGGTGPAVTATVGCSTIY